MGSRERNREEKTDGGRRKTDGRGETRDRGGSEIYKRATDREKMSGDIARSHDEEEGQW